MAGTAPAEAYDFSQLDALLSEVSSTLQEGDASQHNFGQQDTRNGETSAPQANAPAAQPLQDPHTAGQTGIGGPAATVRPGVSFGPGARAVSHGPGPAGGQPVGVPSLAAFPSSVSTGPGIAPTKTPPIVPATGEVAVARPDGRSVIAQGPPCEYCGKVVLGRVTNALGKTWHPEHFVCGHCSTVLSGAYIEHESRPYCEKCYYDVWAPRCRACQQPIRGKIINTGSLQYHPDHFVCVGCGRTLAGRTFHIEDNEPYCSECHKARKIRIEPAVHQCARCKDRIMGEYVIVEGQYYHAEHFTCTMCGKFLQGIDSNEYEGKLYCEEDYRKLLCDVCYGCRKPISGRSITALGHVWHPEHFVCEHCHEPFAGSHFYEMDGKAYCDIHFQQLFADLCAKCNKPVVKDGVRMVEKMWHKKCFVCTACEQPLQKGAITHWEGKPMCKKCFAKLPSDVKERVAREQIMRRKQQKQREKEEAKKRKEEEKEQKQKAKEEEKRKKRERKEKA